MRDHSRIRKDRRSPDFCQAFGECWRVLALRGVDIILQPSAGRFGGKGVGREISKEEQLRNVRNKTKWAFGHTLNDTLNKPTPRPPPNAYGESTACHPSGPSVVLRDGFLKPCSKLQGMIKFKYNRYRELFPDQGAY